MISFLFLRMAMIVAPVSCQNLREPMLWPVLCDALEVNRGTFYNHMKSKQKPSLRTQRRNELSEAVKEVFEENHGLFGSDKILAVLQSRGYKTSKKTVLDIMHDLGLYSFRTTA